MSIRQGSKIIAGMPDLSSKADKETTYTKEEVDNLIQNIDALPEQTNNGGKLLSTDGENALWIDTPSSLPIMDETTSGKFLTNNNGNAEWIDDPDITTNGWNIFDHKFSDHLLNDPSWVRSDTFSWQDGGIYFTAYEELERENGGRIEPLESFETWYAWKNTNIAETLYINKEIPEIGDVMMTVSGDAESGYTFTETDNTVVDYNSGIMFIKIPSLESGDVPATYESGCEAKTDQNIVIDNSIEGNLSTDTYEDITITYYKSVNGLKICLQDQSDAIEQLYANTGVAWYYIIDTENKRFKLPRSKWNFVGSRGNVGDYVDESLPNIKGGWAGVYNSQGLSGAVSGTFKQDGSQPKTVGVDESSQLSSLFEVDASRSSATYQDNAPVQQRATEMYLYFFMGDTLRDARIIDINAAIEKANIIEEKLDNTVNKSTFQVVSELPEDLVENTFYFIVE